MIEILDDEEAEMLFITNSEGKVIFDGNYWDFKRDSGFLWEFIKNLGLECKIRYK